MQQRSLIPAAEHLPASGEPVSADVIAARLEEHWKDAQGALSAATEKALRFDSAVFSAWCAERGLTSLPAEPPTVVGFIDDQALTKKPATIRRYVSSISHMHRAAQLENPCATKKVVYAMKRISKALGVEQKQAAGLIRRMVDPMLRACGEDTIGLRDRALIAVAYDTLARVSELVALQAADFEITTEGHGTIKVRRSKTDQLGEGTVRYLAPDTVAIVQQWLQAAAIQSGYLLRSVRKGGRVGERLPIDDVSRISKRTAMKADLPLDTLGRVPGISAHSTRVGAAQDMAASDGIDLLSIMQAGAWQDAKMPGRYTKKQAATRSGSARLARAQNRLG